MSQPRLAEMHMSVDTACHDMQSVAVYNLGSGILRLEDSETVVFGLAI